MESCPCSIFDVREEQILEADGRLYIRLICNLCGSVLDSKVVTGGEAAPAKPHFQDDGDVAVETGTS